MRLIIGLILSTLMSACALSPKDLEGAAREGFFIHDGTPLGIMDLKCNPDGSVIATAGSPGKKYMLRSENGGQEWRVVHQWSASGLDDGIWLLIDEFRNQENTGKATFAVTGKQAFSFSATTAFGVGQDPAWTASATASWLVSRDGGIGWERLPPLIPHRFTSVSKAGQLLVTSHQWSGEISISEDNGVSWRQHNFDGLGRAQVYASSRGDLLVLGVSGSAFSLSRELVALHSSDHGRRWDETLRVPLPYENTVYGRFSFGQAVGNLDDGLLVFRNWNARDSGRDIHLTYDGGRTWTRVNTEFATPFTHFVPLGSNRWLGLSLNRQWPPEAWESTDGIKWSWRATGYGFERGRITLVKAVPPNTVVAYLGNGKLWRTTNGGRDWEVIAIDQSEDRDFVYFPNMCTDGKSVFVMAINHGRKWTNYGAKVSASIDAGATWQTGALLQ
jgi:hypothetical protein